MHIFRAVKKVPGGLMLVPLLLGALCHTFTPAPVSISVPSPMG